LCDTPIVVTLDELRPYELNPRLTRNPLYDEIKASIKERGLDAPPPITRRPGADDYIIRNGGNTRLSILRELWSETKEERFFRITCQFRPWSERGEPMLNMIEWWICLSMPPDEVEKIARFRELSPAQKALMRSARKESGKFTEGIILSRSMEVLFRAVPPSLYLALAQTEPEEKAERYRLMQEFGIGELDAAMKVAEWIDRCGGSSRSNDGHARTPGRRKTARGAAHPAAGRRVRGGAPPSSRPAEDRQVPDRRGPRRPAR
jgi:hypothetical protein